MWVGLGPVLALVAVSVCLCSVLSLAESSNELVPAAVSMEESVSDSISVTVFVKVTARDKQNLAEYYLLLHNGIL